MGQVVFKSMFLYKGGISMDCREIILEKQVLTIIDFVQTKGRGMHTILNDVMKELLCDRTLTHEQGNPIYWRPEC